MLCQRGEAAKHPCKWNYWKRHWDDSPFKWNLEPHPPVRGSGLSYFRVRSSPGLAHSLSSVQWSLSSLHVSSVWKTCSVSGFTWRRKKKVPVEGVVMSLTWNSLLTQSSPGSLWQPVFDAQQQAAWLQLTSSRQRQHQENMTTFSWQTQHFTMLLCLQYSIYSVITVSWLWFTQSTYSLYTAHDWYYFYELGHKFIEKCVFNLFICQTESLCIAPTEIIWSKICFHQNFAKLCAQMSKSRFKIQQNCCKLEPNLSLVHPS